MIIQGLVYFVEGVICRVMFCSLALSIEIIRLNISYVVPATAG